MSQIRIYLGGSVDPGSDSESGFGSKGKNDPKKRKNKEMSCSKRAVSLFGWQEAFPELASSS